MPETNSSTPEFAARPSGGFDREAVWAHVNRILGSPAFVRSQRRRDLLSWLVRAALEDRGDEITERKVATEVFGRSRDFEPAEDPIVRVEISRLRLNLEAFYATEGRGEPVAISIPKGSYVPAFTWVAGNAKPFAAVPEARPRAVEAPAAVKIAFVPRSGFFPCGGGGCRFLSWPWRRRFWRRRWECTGQALPANRNSSGLPTCRADRFSPRFRPTDRAWHLRGMRRDMEDSRFASSLSTANP